MPEPVTIITTLNFSKTLLTFFGLINGVSQNVQKLVHQPFKTGKKWLEHAQNASSKDLRNQYLHDAQVEFGKAIELEENENKILSILGLAICQFYLGDINNANSTIREIQNVRLTTKEKIKGAFYGEIDMWVELLVSSPQVAGLRTNRRTREFNDLKEKVTQIHFEK